MTRHPRRRTSHPLQVRSLDLGDLWHADTCGPISPPSLGGNRYFCVFVNDFSGFTQVVFMQSRSEVFNKFRVLNEQSNARLGRGVKMLLSDNAKEFLRPFETYCEENGIIHVASTPYVHQENAVAERAIRNLWVERELSYMQPSYHLSFGARR